MSVEWTDDFLVWENDEVYSELDYLVVEPKEIWTPPYVIANSLKQDIFAYPRGNLVGIYPNGSAEYFPVATVETECPFILRYWPFDEHKCSYRATTTTYATDQLNFKVYRGNLAWNFFRLEYSETWNVVKSNWTIGETCLTDQRQRQNCYPLVWNC